jgi:hypothetical protein
VEVVEDLILMDLMVVLVVELVKEILEVHLYQLDQEILLQ